jgi:hypothetical protein
MKHIFVMLLSLYIIFAHTLYAVDTQYTESTSPPSVPEAIKVPATLKVDPFLKINIGTGIETFKAEFEKTTLEEIRDTLKTGTIQHAGDAAESLYWLCYTLPDQRVWFISHGEMGGPNHALTQVQATIKSSISHGNFLCPEMPTRFKSISFDFGWLGTKKKSFIEAIGSPSGSEDGRLMYHYAGKIQKTHNGIVLEGDITSYVEVTLVDNKITSLNASHITSF